jgi:hypothetical protein
MPHTQWDTPIGEARLNLQQRLADLDHRNAQLLLEIARDTRDAPVVEPVRGATPAGEEQRLRGIPVQGFGGAINGTRPGNRWR